MADVRNKDEEPNPVKICKMCNHDKREFIEQFAFERRDRGDFPLAWHRIHRSIFEVAIKEGWAKTVPTDAQIRHHMQAHSSKRNYDCIRRREDVKGKVRRRYTKQMMKGDATDEEIHNRLATVVGHDRRAVEASIEFEREAIAAEIARNINEIEKLDSIIEREYLLWRKGNAMMAKQMVDLKEIPSNYTSFLRTINQNITNAMVTKAKLLGTDADSRKAAAAESWFELLKNCEMAKNLKEEEEEEDAEP